MFIIASYQLAIVFSIASLQIRWNKYYMNENASLESFTVGDKVAKIVTYCIFQSIVAYSKDEGYVHLADHCSSHSRRKLLKVRGATLLN